MDPALLNAIGSGSLAVSLAYAVRALWSKLSGKEAEEKAASTAALAREDAIRAEHHAEVAKIRATHAEQMKSERDEQRKIMQELLETLKGIE